MPLGLRFYGTDAGTKQRCSRFVCELETVCFQQAVAPGVGGAQACTSALDRDCCTYITKPGQNRRNALGAALALVEMSLARPVPW